MSDAGGAIIVDLSDWRDHVMQSPGDIFLTDFARTVGDYIPPLIPPKTITFPHRIFTEKRPNYHWVVALVSTAGVGCNQGFNFFNIEQPLYFGFEISQGFFRPLK